MVVWPGAQSGEDYNPMNGTIYTVHKNALGVKIPEWGKAATNESQFVSWCKSINCTAIFQVPGEIDNTTTAKWIVEYTEDKGQIADPAFGGRNVTALDFHPAYWEIGNEPELWRLYNIPWTEWKPSAHSYRIGNATTGPGVYARLVQNYTSAMREVDPNIKIIGIPATGRPNGMGPLENWIGAVVALDGPNISGVAYHSYPARESPITLPTFYGAINGSAGLTGRVAEARSGIANGSAESKVASCQATCSERVGLFVTEFGTGLSHTMFGPWERSFPGVLSFAAQVTQAIDLNVTNLDVFASVFNTNNSWLNLHGGVRPSYTLFSEIFNHLGNVAYPVRLATSPQYDGTNTTLGGNLYGIATTDPKDAGRADLMVVNLNLTTNVTFSPKLPGIAAGTPAEVWEWQGNVSDPPGNFSLGASVEPMTTQPVAQYFPEGLPANWTLPLQTLALFESYPGGGVQVNFTASGFSSEAPLPRWFIDVGGAFATSNGTDNLTFFLPSGTFNVTAPPIPLQNGSPVTADLTERLPRERLEPFPPSFVRVYPNQVAGPPIDFGLTFAHQWATNISATTNNSAPGTGTVGYVTPAPLWWNASTPLTLTARPAYHYVFTRWEGFGNGSSNSTDPQTALFPTAWITQKAIFTWAEPVTFTETGLPAGTNWSVTVHSHITLDTAAIASNSSLASRSNIIAFEEPNGTYGFTIGAVPGYRASLSNTSYLTNSSVNVSGVPAFVPIAFTPIAPPVPRYAVTFVESGLPSDARWWLATLNVTTTQVGNQTTVNVSNQTASSETNTIVIEETNGTFDYHTGTIAGFRAHPPAFGYNVSGSGRVVFIQFSPVRYAVVWKEADLGPNLSWSVAVSNGSATTTNESVGAWTTFHLVNGTYSFEVPPAADYVPVTNASGTFNVNGANVSFYVLFPEVSFPVTFAVSGLPSGNTWQVRFSDNLTLNVSRAATTFRAPNGSYTFDVLAPPGYLADPSHGTITVDAAAIMINVSMVIDGPPPCPPIWNLACPAMVACAAITVVGVGTLLIGRTRKRRRSGGTS